MKLKTKPYVTPSTIARWCEVLALLDGKRIDDVCDALYVHPSAVLKRIETMEAYVNGQVATRPIRGSRFQPWRLTDLGRQVLADNR